MPKIQIVFYRDDDGSVPVLDLLERVGRRDMRAYLKCRTRIELLRDEGIGLRRPMCDYLGNGIYELRILFGHVNYRVLYFFDGATAAILAHGLMKEAAIPPRDLAQAVARKENYIQDPEGHSYYEQD